MPAWPAWKIGVWAAVALAAVALRGPGFVGVLRPDDGKFLDFSQEWLSARNYWTGTPVYTPQGVSLPRHTGFTAPDVLPWNAHPPASVLVALPFGQITDYPTAHLAWNLATLPLFAVSLAVVVWQLRLPFVWWSLLPVVALALLSHPLTFNVLQGQINFVVLFLVTLGWAADRNDRQAAAGLAFGLAAGLKLFPGFLFVYLLFAGRWRALGVGVGACVAVNAAALVAFGTEAFDTYARQVVPSVLEYRASWRNVSATGVWTRAFGATPKDKLIPLADAPAVAQALGVATQLALAALAGWVAWTARAADREARDRALAVALVGMVLASPLAWGHYFVILMLPLALLWDRLTGWQRWLFWPLVVVLWIPENVPAMVALGPRQAFLANTGQNDPIPAAVHLTALSVFAYALVGVLGLLLVARRRAADRG